MVKYDKIMHKPIFIANWKMNLNLSEQKNLLAGIVKQNFSDKVDMVVCPSYTNIPITAKEIKNTSIALGAQDVSWVNKGSMTGEVSADMLKDFGVKYVVVGHSERRGKIGETNEMVNAKVKACLDNNLIPVICVGETAEQHQYNQTDDIIEQQVSTALAGIVLQPYQSIIIAYEPVWVIGTGHVVDAEIAEHEAQVIKNIVYDCCSASDREVDDLVTVLYGGSVNSENVADFISANIRGVLVGGASLEVDEFTGIATVLAGQKAEN